MLKLRFGDNKNVLVLLAILGFLFLWFELRPTFIKAFCMKKAKDCPYEKIVGVLRCEEQGFYERDNIENMYKETLITWNLY